MTAAKKLARMMVLSRNFRGPNAFAEWRRLHNDVALRLQRHRYRVFWALRGCDT